MSDVPEREERRPRLIWAACWGVWLFVVPIILLSVARLVGVPGLSDTSADLYRMPLPAGLVPLLMFVASTIGLWGLRRWGVYLYGAAGLVGLGMMAFWPGASELFPASRETNALAWALLGAAHATYTFRLWAKVPGAGVRRDGAQAR